MKKVTGIGGIFFKCQDKAQMADWYEKNLGLKNSGYGTTFDWIDAEDSSIKGSTTWSPFAQTTKYFEPSTKDFMINYIVDDIEGLVTELKNSGVTVVDNIEDSDFGKFVHI